MKKILPEKELGENTFEVIISYEDISIDINEIEILLVINLTKYLSILAI